MFKRCLGKDPEARWQDAADMAHELEWLSSDSAAAGGPATTTASSRRGWHMMRRGLVLASALLIMVAGGLTLWSRVVPTRSSPEILSRPITASSTWASDPALSPEGDLVAFTAGDTASTNIWVVSVSGGTPMRVTDGPALDSKPVWFPDSSQIAFASANRLGLYAIWRVSLGGDRCCWSRMRRPPRSRGMGGG